MLLFPDRNVIEAKVISPSNSKIKLAFRLIFGFGLGISFTTIGGYLFLLATNSSLSIDDAKLTIVKRDTSVSTSIPVSTNQSQSVTNYGIASEHNEGAIASSSSTAVKNDDVIASQSGVAFKNVDGTGNPVITGKVDQLTINYGDLPGFFPEQGFKVKPPNIDRFKEGILLSDVISGKDFVKYETAEILVKSNLYRSPLRINGSFEEKRRVGFKLSGTQNALFLQFALRDLESGETTLKYSINILVDGKIYWAGECEYGTSKQILSVPLEVYGNKSVVIEYIVSDNSHLPNYSLPPLYLTKADVLYKI